jgi:hypothetical protein
MFYDVLETIDYSDLNKSESATLVKTLNADKEALQGKLLTIEQALNNNMLLMEKSKNPEIFVNRLDDLYSEKSEVLKQLQMIKIQIESVSSVKDISPIKIDDLSDDEVTTALRDQIKTITLTKNKLSHKCYKHYIDIEFMNGEYFESLVDDFGDISMCDTRK